MKHIEERYNRIDTLEARLTRRIELALLRELELLVSLLLQGVSPILIPGFVSKKTLKPVLDEMYEKVIVQEAKYEYQYLMLQTKAAGLPITDWLRRARNFITVESSKAIVAITNTTRQEVRKVLKESAAAGYSIVDTAKNMRTKLTAFSTMRAKRIARTELIGAMNIGAFIGASTTGLVLDKIWLATADGRTRDTHSAANGQQVDIKAPFIIGGIPCQYPADPALSARERINCRCTQLFKPRAHLRQGELDL